MLDWISEQPTLVMNLSLVGVSFVTAIVSGMMGVMGGTLLVSFMSLVFAPAVVVPLHGVVQLGSNLSRAILHFKNIHWVNVIPFALGSILGAALGSRVVVALSVPVYSLLLGGLIIVITWIPPVKTPGSGGVKFFSGGIVITFLSLFVGAIGPLVAPLVLRQKLSKFKTISTIAACQVFLHGFKVAAFIFLGFHFGPYLSLLIAMVVAGFFGNWVGKLLLGKVPEALFRLLLRLVITALAVRLVMIGLTGSSAIH